MYMSVAHDKLRELEVTGGVCVCVLCIPRWLGLAGCDFFCVHLGFPQVKSCISKDKMLAMLKLLLNHVGTYLCFQIAELVRCNFK